MKLVIFDVDGTLVDSQAHIVGAMARAFETHGETAPSRSAVLNIVGLSVAEAIAALAPGSDAEAQANLGQAFKTAYGQMRHEPETVSALYSGARDALEALACRDEVLLAVATGNSRRGLTHVLELHDLVGHFVSTQTADDHPSKPHPAMIEACLSETGATKADTVMIGDTTYDMDMARAAGVTGLGVNWGYHDAANLRAVGATDVLDDYAQLLPWLAQHWGTS